MQVRRRRSARRRACERNSPIAADWPRSPPVGSTVIVKERPICCEIRTPASLQARHQEATRQGRTSCRLSTSMHQKHRRCPGRSRSAEGKGTAHDRHRQQCQEERQRPAGHAVARPVAPIRRAAASSSSPRRAKTSMKSIDEFGQNADRHARLSADSLHVAMFRELDRGQCRARSGRKRGVDDCLAPEAAQPPEAMRAAMRAI